MTDNELRAKAEAFVESLPPDLPGFTARVSHATTVTALVAAFREVAREAREMALLEAASIAKTAEADTRDVADGAVEVVVIATRRAGRLIAERIEGLGEPPPSVSMRCKCAGDDGSAWSKCPTCGGFATVALSPSVGTPTPGVPR